MKQRHGLADVSRWPSYGALLNAVALSLIVVAGCSGSFSSSPPTERSSGSSLEMWRTAELRDVRTGETFRISDRAGRLVVIEPMAIWCANCRTQQNEVRQALADIERDDVVYISLDVDPNETDDDLARYADEAGFGWHFVVASREVSRSLVQSFGDQVLSPPSTPAIVIAPDGRARVHFGIRRAAELRADLTALLQQIKQPAD